MPLGPIAHRRRPASARGDGRRVLRLRVQARNRRHCIDRARGRGPDFGLHDRRPARVELRASRPLRTTSRQKSSLRIFMSFHPEHYGNASGWAKVSHTRKDRAKPRYSAANHKRVRLDLRAIDRVIPSRQIGPDQDIGTHLADLFFADLCCAPLSLGARMKEAPC